MTPEVFVTKNPGQVTGELVVEALRKAELPRVLALSGGNTQIPVLQWLATHWPAEFEDVLVTWVDERHLPLTESADWRDLPAESNLRLAWEHWFSKVATPPRLLPMARPGTLAEATSAFLAEAPSQISVALLGAGSDGHIASLFPERDELWAAGVAISVNGAPKPPPDRITLTMRYLQDCELAVLVATGEEKSEMLARARGGDGFLPLGRYDPIGRYVWVLDMPAAADLTLAGDHS
jgi:6-phosphogluconolactonase